MGRLVEKCGFALVELMIVIAIIGLVSAIAIPSFLKSRQTAQDGSCTANLKQIIAAKTLWSLDTNAVTGSSVTWSVLVTDYIKATPSCAAGGAYTLGNLGVVPSCDVSGHSL